MVSFFQSAVGNSRRALGFFIVFILAVSVSAQAQAQVERDLALCIDVSTSVDNTELEIQLQGTSHALDVLLPTDGTVRISAFLFGTSVYPVDLNPSSGGTQSTRIVDSTTAKSNIVAAIAGATRSGTQFTNTGGCIAAATAALIQAGADNAVKIIDISTDGIPTVDSSGDTCSSGCSAANNYAISASNAAGLDDDPHSPVDSLNVIVVGNDIATTTMIAIAYPKAVGTHPTDGDGFVYIVDDFLQFRPAIATKVATELSLTTLSLQKIVVNDEGGSSVVGDFSISTSAGSLNWGTGITIGDTTTYSSDPIVVEPGTFSLTEASVAGYVEGTWSCNGGTNPVGTFNAGSITLAAEDVVTCVITNNDSVAQNPSIEILKNGALDISFSAPPGALNAGDRINYTFDVHNTGDTQLTDVSVTDNVVGSISCTPEANPIVDMAPDEQVQCTGSYIVQQTDINSGKRDNIATATGTPPQGDDVSDTSDHSEPLVGTPLMTLDKAVTNTGTGSGGAFVKGDTIEYGITVTNTGNVTLTNVVVNDALAGLTNAACSASLAPTLSCSVNTGTYVVLQSDIDTNGGGDGDIDNTAVASSIEAPDAEDSAEAPLARNTSIHLTKSASPEQYSDAGQIITYTFVVSNNGTVTLHDVEVTDVLPGVEPVTCDWANSTDSGTSSGILSPGEIVNCSAELTTTEQHLSVGTIANTATASGYPPESQVPETFEDDANVELLRLNLSKTATEAVDNGNGTYDVTYTITATNLGSVVHSYNVVDQLQTGAAVTPIAIVNPLAYQAGTEVQQTGTLEPVVVGNLSVGATLVSGELLAAGLTESWTITIRYELDSSLLTPENSDCSDDKGETGHTGFANQISGSSSDNNPQDNRACVPIKAIVMAAEAFCQNDVPWVHYSVNVFGIPDFQPSDINYSFVNVEDDYPDEIVVAGPTPLAVLEDDILWPGASADGGEPGANGLTWPGWTESPPGVWVQSPTAQTPNLVFRMQINPTDQVTLSYPPAEPLCVAAPPAEMEVSKSIDDVTITGNTVDVTYRIAVTNLGGQVGEYNIIDRLLADESLLPVDLVNPVTYQAGTENSQVGVINLPVLADFISGATLVNGESLAAGMSEGFVFTLRFEIIPNTVTIAGLNCDPTDDGGGNTGLTNHVALAEGEIVISEDDACEPIVLDRTTFTVTKDFTDDNPMGVEVELDCNTGLILDQTKVITEGEYVEFVVTSFDPGELDCDISETPVSGYTPEYQVGSEALAIAGSVSSDASGCQFEEVVAGKFSCHIVNTPDPVQIVIEKQWAIEGSASDIDTYFELTLTCDSEIIDGYQGYCSAVNLSAGSVNQPQGISQTSWCKQFNGDGPATFYADVIPQLPSTSCSVYEQVFDNSIEIDNGCTNLHVSAGQGDSCIITNTVFFEGIPTLGALGKMLMIMLMLGAGMLVYRRSV